MAQGEALRRDHEGAALGLAAEVAFAGGVSGVVAGAVMAAFLMVLGSWIGLGGLGVMRGMAGLFYGWSAVGGGGGPAFWGLAIHFATAIAFGLLFAAMVPRNADPLASVVGGILYAIAVWAIMTWVVIRIVDRPLADVVDHMPFGWLSAHIAYGIVLGAASQLRGIAVGETAPRRR